MLLGQAGRVRSGLAGIFGGSLLVLTATASAWQLAQVHDMQRPNGLFASVAHPNVRTLRADLATLSAQRVGDELAKPVQVQMGVEPDPLLAWYLRDRRVVDWIPAPDDCRGRFCAPRADPAAARWRHGCKHRAGRHNRERLSHTLRLVTGTITD